MKIVRYSVLLLVGLVWIAGCSSDILSFLYTTQAIPDDYRYGDLYRLSNLEKFKDPKSTCSPFPITKSTTRQKKIALYIIGDSFTEPQRIGAEDFDVDYYHYVHWGTTLHLKLDSSYTNIVLLESVERNVREHFGTPISLITPDSATFVTIPQDTRLVSQVDHLFASAPVEDRLTTILFQFDPILALKEVKSWINYNLFDRTDPKVTVAADGATIVYVEDTDTSYTKSSFSVIEKQELDTIVGVMKQNESYLRSLGFDQVWLSIIPNKASILMPDYGKYNHLIERIYQHPQRSGEAIDVYQDFANMKEAAYLRGDSHWSCAGQHLWLGKVNRLLRQNTIPQASPLQLQ